MSYSARRPPSVAITMRSTYMSMPKRGGLPWYDSPRRCFFADASTELVSGLTTGPEGRGTFFGVAEATATAGRFPVGGRGGVAGGAEREEPARGMVEDLTAIKFGKAGIPSSTKPSDSISDTCAVQDFVSALVRIRPLYGFNQQYIIKKRTLNITRIARA